MVLPARLCVWLIFLLPGSVLARDSVTITPEACFVGMAPRGGVFPISVSLQNTGASADGALVVKSESYSDILRTYTYPVSLPTGTSKVIVVYPAVSNGAYQIDFSFDGTANAKDVSLHVDEREGMQIGMISDESGALSALRLNTARPVPHGFRQSSTQTVPYNDCYSRPEDAPDRAAGYQSVSVLILGAGAERLRPEQWAAIRRWVLDGGSLILTGGPGASYLRETGAASLLPETSLHDITVPALALPAKMLSAPLPGGPVALVTGTLKPGGTGLAFQGGMVTLARQAQGAGTVLLTGFDPLQQPFRGWAKKPDLWRVLIHLAVANVPAWNLRQWTAQQTSFTMERYGTRSVYSTPHHIDPFRIKLPPLGTVAWIFLAYFVLVIPVTYAVLKKMRRLEWAWVTSPLLSIAFAYVFYLFTAQLYLAGMSRRTSGVLVGVAGSPDAQFDGFSEFFIPHGGSYAVAIPGAEAIELSPFSGDGGDDGYYSYSSRSGGTPMQPLNTVDGGDVAVPNFALGNLAFRRLYHTEPVSLDGAVTATLVRRGQGVSGTLRNGTGQTLRGCYVYVPRSGAYSPIGDLSPGETRPLGGRNTMRNDEINQISPFANATFKFDKYASSSAFLIARTDGTPYGPASLGRDVGGPQSVLVLVSLPVAPGDVP